MEIEKLWVIRKGKYWNEKRKQSGKLKRENGRKGKGKGKGEREVERRTTGLTGGRTPTTTPPLEMAVTCFLGF